MNPFESDKSQSGEPIEANPQTSHGAKQRAGGAEHPDRTGNGKLNRHSHFKFVLYVAGGSPYSEEAVSNLRNLCIEHLQDQHEFEIVDVLCDPRRALADQIMLTPTLVKLSPGPVQRIVGSLKLGAPILRALGVPDPDEAAA